jgi:hypothetical protein
VKLITANLFHRQVWAGLGPTSTGGKDLKARTDADILLTGNESGIYERADPKN